MKNGRNGTRALVGLTAVAIALLGSVNPAAARNRPGERCQYELTPSGEETGSAVVTIRPARIRVEVEDAFPHALYTVWIDFKNRATGELPPDYPFPADDPGSLHGPGIERGVAPGFAAGAPVFSGMRMDRNGFVTDDHGRARFRTRLDHNLLQPGASPVVAADLVNQGEENRVGGGWLRLYEEPVFSGPSLQQVDDETGEPILVRATVQGITIVRHSDFFTHGHTPGVGGVDHFSAFKGDFPADCLP